MGTSAQRRPQRSVPPSKVLGNGLRELDRFLSVLIDEVAATIDIEDDARALLSTRRNTANKLRSLLAVVGRGSPDHLRLRALGRSRDCLFYCGGTVRRADRRAGSSMTTGWASRSGSTSATVRLGRQLRIDGADIADICRFYDRIAGDLLAVSDAARTPRPDMPRKPVAFLPGCAHITLAIVACDGF